MQNSYNGMLLPNIARCIDLAAQKEGTRMALAIETPIPAFDKGKYPNANDSKPIGTWQQWTFSDYRRDIRLCGRAMMKYGVEQFGSVSVYGFNNPSWHISALSAMYVNGKAAGIYPTDTNEQITFKIAHSSSSVVVVEGLSKLNKVLDLLDGVPTVKAIVVYNFEADDSNTEMVTALKVITQNKTDKTFFSSKPNILLCMHVVVMCYRLMASIRVRMLMSSYGIRFSMRRVKRLVRRVLMSVPTASRWAIAL